MDSAFKKDLLESQLLPSLALLGSMVSMAIGSSFAKRLFPAVGAEGATALRLIGGALMLMIILRPWRTLRGITTLRPVFLYGVAMGGMMLLFYLSLRRIPLGIALALEFTGPLAITIWSSRKLADFLWLALACIGLLLLLPVISGLQSIDFPGAMMALGAGACWGAYILAGRAAAESHGMAAAALGTSVAALLVTPLGFARAGDKLLQAHMLFAALPVAFLSSAVPYLLEMYALRHLKAQTYGTLASCDPAIGMLVGLTILHEMLTLTQVFAIGLIVVAAAGATTTAAWNRREPVQTADLLPR